MPVIMDRVKLQGDGGLGDPVLVDEVKVGLDEECGEDEGSSVGVMINLSRFCIWSNDWSA